MFIKKMRNKIGCSDSSKSQYQQRSQRYQLFSKNQPIILTESIILRVTIVIINLTFSLNQIYLVLQTTLMDPQTQIAIDPSRSYIEHPNQSQQSRHISTHERESVVNDSVKYQAYFHAFVSNVFLTAIGYFVKELAYYYPSFIILGFRGSLLFILNIAVMKYNNVSFDLPNREGFVLMMKRSVLSAIAMTLYLGPMQFIPIGIASTLFNTSPLMTFFIEALYYKHTKIQWSHVMIACVCFIGIVMIIQPDFLMGQPQEDKTFEHLLQFFVLISSFLASLAMMIMHDLRKHSNQYCTLQYGYVFQGGTSFVMYMFFADTFSDPQNYTGHGIESFQDLLIFSVLIVSLILSSFIAHYTRVKSAYLIKPSYVMPFAYVSVITGMLVDVIVFKSEYNLLMIVGAIFTSCGLLIKFIVQK